MSLQILQEPDSYIAGKVFPMVPSKKEADFYYKYQDSDFFKDQAKKRAPNTEAQIGDYSLTTDNFFCQEWSFGTDISVREYENADNPLDPEGDATRFVTEILKIRKERLWMENFFGASIWGTDVQGGVGFTVWSDYTNGTPVADVKSWRRAVQLATGKKPNKLVLTPDVWDVLCEAPDVKNRLQYNNTKYDQNGGNVTTGMVAMMMELDEILIADAVYNTDEAPGSSSNAFIAGEKKALLCYAEPNPGIRRASAGYTFAWTGKQGVNSEAMFIATEEVPLRNTWERVEGSMFFQQKVVAASLGYYAYDVIA
jgi:hypothetical protein